MDLKSLPLTSKFILILGFLLFLLSFILFFRYTIMLILMKYNPEYREFIQKTLKNKKLKKKSPGYGGQPPK